MVTIQINTVAVSYATQISRVGSSRALRWPPMQVVGVALLNFDHSIPFAFKVICLEYPTPLWYSVTAVEAGL